MKTLIVKAKVKRKLLTSKLVYCEEKISSHVQKFSKE
jgi:hypothetical protein